MKYISKLTLQIVSLSILIISCKHHLNPAVIKTYTDENKTLEQKVSEMKKFQEQTLSEMETGYSEMMSAIDPKRKAAYHRDKAIRAKMDILENKIKGAI